MTRARSTKASLFSSLIALLLCFAMLLGTTYAWFTDSVTSAGNLIQAGSLQIDLSHKVGDGWVSLKKEPDHPVFNYDEWEPGYTGVETLRIENLGNLALRYKLSITVDAGSATTGKNGENLADVIDVYITKGESNETSFDAIQTGSAWEKVGTLSEVMKNPASFFGGQLLPAGKTPEAGAPATVAVGSQFVSIALHMQESAGNGYQELSVGNVYVNLVATQWSNESDAFGSDYDAEAVLPLAPGVLCQVSAPVSTDADGKVTSDVNLGNAGDTAHATLPAGVKLEAGTEEVALEVSVIKDRAAVVEMNGGDVAIPLDVHVGNVASDNSVPILVTLNDVFPKNYASYNIRLFHVENGNTVAMTAVDALADLDAHNEYYYDNATGTVTLALVSFSEVTAAVTAGNAWDGKTYDYTWYDENYTEYTISTADQFAAFAQIVGGMASGITRDSFAGKTVKLGANMNMGGNTGTEENPVIFTPVGYYFTNDADKNGTPNENKADIYSDVYSFEGTFDGQGYTVSNILQRTWDIKGDDPHYSLPAEQYYNDGMGLFGWVHNGTVKNLAIDNFQSDGEFCTTGCVAAYSSGVSTFENIRITNCNPRAYNVPNGGVVGYAYDESTVTTNSITFNNVTVDPTTKISALWGSWDVGCGGILGRLGDTTKLTMTNCTVGAIIDVFNDVCGNYQYYQYRYAGMLIGTVGSDGDTSDQVENMNFENVQVYYGDWSQNYNYYCELVENSLASYTHDYQFSRLDMIDSLYDITSDGVSAWDTVGNFVLVKGDVATCYHIRKNADGTFYQHKHEDKGTETVDGNEVLVENNQCVHLPFKQFYAGYGWGADHTTDIANVVEAKYTVTFLNANGDVLDVQYVTTDAAITVADYDDTAIKLLGDGYDFKSWTTAGAKDITTIEAGNAKNYVLYATAKGVYTARWVDTDGNVIATEIFEEGTTALKSNPAVPVVDGYNVAWSDYTLGNADVTIYPVLTIVNGPAASGTDEDGDGMPDYYEIEASDQNLGSDVEIPGDINGVPVKVVTDLTTETVNTSVQNVVVKEGVEEIKAGAFAGTANLKSVELPSTITKIEDGAFYDDGIMGSLGNLVGRNKSIEIKYNGTKDEWDQVEENSGDWEQGLAVGTKVICTDGVYEVTARRGGIGNYTYTWEWTPNAN